MTTYPVQGGRFVRIGHGRAYIAVKPLLTSRWSPSMVCWRYAVRRQGVAMGRDLVVDREHAGCSPVAIFFGAVNDTPVESIKLSHSSHPHVPHDIIWFWEVRVVMPLYPTVVVL